MNILSINSAIAIIALLSTNIAIAMPPAPPPMMPPAGPSQTLSADNQYYEYSVSGIKKYLDSIEQSDPSLYAAVKPKYEDIKFKRDLSLGLSIGAAVVGAGLVYGSMTFLARKTESDIKSINIPLFTGGIYTMMAAPFFYYIFSPSQNDYLDFINSNNRANPSRPLKLSFDVNPAASQYGLSLTQRF